MAPLTSYLLETLLTLLGVVALAVLVLAAARRVGVGRPSGPMELLGRLPLDGRRTVFLVRVADAVYVIGSSEAGLSKLGELSGAEFPPSLDSTSTKPLTELLAEKVLGRSAKGGKVGE